MITLNHRLYINLGYSTNQHKEHDPTNYADTRVHVTRRESDMPNHFFLHIGNGIVIAMHHDDWNLINQEVNAVLNETCEV